MVSSASAQIESTAGAKLKTEAGLPDYGKVSIILIAVVSAAIILCALVGNEQHASNFEKGKSAFEEGGGLDVIEQSDRVQSVATDYEKGYVQKHEVAHMDRVQE
jgi:SHS family lactate transporter-like MFS transporter